MGLQINKKSIRDLYCVKRLQFALFSRKRSQGQFVVSLNQGGLCNRIKCLISSMRLANKLSRTVALLWVPDANCGCRFSNLFENEIFELRPSDLYAFMSRPDKFKIDQWYMVNTWRLLTMPNELPEGFSRAYKSISGKGIDHEYDRIPWTIRDDYSAYIDALVPIRFIKNEVEVFFNARFDKKTISVHVRSWSDFKKRNQELFNIENLYRTLDKEEDSSFFISCDSEDVLKKIKSRYGRRVIDYPLRTFASNRDSKIGIQDALITLLLLSKNKRLKVSAFSTFSEMAWWFGGCRASVESMDNESMTQKYLDFYLEDFDKFTPSDLLEKAMNFHDSHSADG